MSIQEILDNVRNGDMDPLKAFIQLKAKEKAAKAALDEIQVEAVEKAATYGEKTFKAFGVEVGCKSSAGRWDFKELGWWQDFEDKKDDAKKAFKLIDRGKTVLDDDGVVVEPAKYTPGKDIISIKL